MKLLFSFATIVAAAGIGKLTSHDFSPFLTLMLVMIAQVLAVPLLVVHSNNLPSTNLRNYSVDNSTEIAITVKKKKGPCRAHRFRQKAVEVSNLFREAFGLPLIQSGGHPGLDDGKVRILPFIGTPSTFAPVHGKNTVGNIEVITISAPYDHPHPHHAHVHTHGRHRHHKGFHHFGKGSFINRIHYSIMNLGRWEGRAVAFVLGKIFPVLFFF